MEEFKRIYSAGNFTGIATANVACVAGNYTKVGTLTVPAQQAVCWGGTDIINGGATGRALYIAFVDSAAAYIEGTVRLSVANATETSEQVVLEERTERLRADTSDRSKAVLLPRDGRFAKQDSKLIIKFYPDAATTQTIVYNGTNTKILAPVTVQQ